MNTSPLALHFPTVDGKKPPLCQVYLVGGYVRDQLLGRPAHERDWVVVGATPELLLQEGYTPVGKAFPVFLHPKTHEEYALARTERKVSTGHTGFVCVSDPTVTLEQDLQRRDLTINAIAMTDKGELIDPYGGYQDLQDRLLRHVSSAFAEDPLRVLRVARLRAQLARFHFSVAPETLHLMQHISQSGELSSLSVERIWEELKKALLSEQPLLFFETLTACGAIAPLFPGVTQGISVLAHIDTPDISTRFAALFFETPTLAAAPADCLQLAQLVHDHHQAIDHALTLTSSELLALLKRTDALRRPERFSKLLTVCQAIAQTKTTSSSYLPKTFLQRLQQHLAQLDLTTIIQQDIPDFAKAKAIAEKRAEAIQTFIGNFR